MNYFMPAFLLISALAGSVWAAMPKRLKTSGTLKQPYQKCRRGEALLPAFSKKLLALQQQAVNQSDFEKSQTDSIRSSKHQKDILSPPSSNTIDLFFFIGKAWKKNGTATNSRSFWMPG